MTERPVLPADTVEALNAVRGGFNTTMGLTFTRVEYDEVVATVAVGPHLTQPYGLVHGGVYCAMVETLASTGAAINARVDGRHTVGLENTTSFLKAVREGTLTGRATPLTRGRQSHVWTVEIRDDQDRLVAQGRVRLLCLAAGASVAGQQVAVQSDRPTPRTVPDPSQ